MNTPSAPPPPPLAPVRSPSPWLWFFPLLAFALFIAAVGGLLWFNERLEREEQRVKMISDTLWLEQNLRFQFNRHSEILAALNPAQAASTQAFEAQVGILLGSQEGLLRVAWYDTRHRPVRVHPGLMENLFKHDPARLAAIHDEQALARSVGHAVFGKPRANSDGDWLFDMHVPAYHDGQLSGFAVAVYSIRKLFNEAMPWWLAERYRLSVNDASGALLHTRSKVGASEPRNEAYQVAFDPPGQGLTIELAPYPQTEPLAARLLPASLVLLALLMLWSLWALRRHVRQRIVAETALRQEYALRRAMDDSLHTGMRALDIDNRISFVNTAFCRMVGFSADELLGKTAPHPWWPPEEHDNIRAALAAARSPGQLSSVGVEMRLMRRGGERFDALLYEAPLIDAQGRHTGWMGSLLDITERKRARELARQQEAKLATTARLVSMGEMASSLAHELSQPLAAIASYNAGCANMLAAGDANLDDLKAALDKSAEQAQRAGRIIRRIYEFVRRAEPKAEACDIGFIVDETLGFIEADVRHQRIRIERSISADLPQTLGDRVLLGQAFLNLLRNAIESMRESPPAARRLTVRVAPENEGILVTIADQGRGIGEEESKRLFEPFYSTKAEGMGMGLNICRSVIEAHHGRLDYAPNPGGGSVFRAWFPVTPPP